MASSIRLVVSVLATFVGCLSLAALAPTVSSSATAPVKLPKCSADQGLGCVLKSRPPTDCSGGVWPSQSDRPGLVMPYTSRIVQLNLVNIDIRDADHVQPIPAPPASTSLDGLSLENIRVKSTKSNQSPNFPLRKLTSQLNLTGLVYLTLNQVKLNLTEDFFTGFTGLRSLEFNNCTIVGWSLASLQPMVVLESFQLHNDFHLTAFQWAVLAPVAKTLETIEFIRNWALMEINSSPPQPGGHALSFPRLADLTIRDTKLQRFPVAALDAFASCPSASSAVQPQGYPSCSLTFKKNQHDCTNCTTFEPLVKWAQGKPGRFTTVTCEKRQDSPVGHPCLMGSSGDWQQFFTTCGLEKPGADSALMLRSQIYFCN